MPSTYARSDDNPWMGRLVRSWRSRMGFTIIAFAFLALTTTLAVTSMMRSGYVQRVPNWKYLILPVFAFQLSFLSYGLAPFLGLLARRELDNDPLLPECATTFLEPADYLEPVRAAINRWFVFGAVIALFYFAMQLWIWNPFRMIKYGGLYLRLPRHIDELLYLLHALHVTTMLNQLAGFRTRAALTAATELRRFPFYGGAILVMALSALVMAATFVVGVHLLQIHRLMLQSMRDQNAMVWAVVLMIGIQAFYLFANSLIAPWIWRRAERRFEAERESAFDQSGGAMG